MALEVELKYAVDDFDSLRRCLEDIGAARTDRFFEQNSVFDTDERTLWRQGMLLRLRQAGPRSVICLKKPPPSAGSPEVKVFEELQTRVEDPEQLRDLFLSLGYIEAFRYEKLREKWILDECLICLDLLPFGRYVEIEGRREAIFECAARLGLSRERCTTKTYHQLNQEKRAEKGLSPDESFIFSGPERLRLIERNDFFC